MRRACVLLFGLSFFLKFYSTLLGGIIATRRSWISSDNTASCSVDGLDDNRDPWCLVMKWRWKSNSPWGMLGLLADGLVFPLTLTNVPPAYCTVEMQSGNPP